MTSAAELFFNRRFRLGTRSHNPNSSLAVDPTFLSDLHRHPPRRRVHRHGEVCGHSRHRVFAAEHEPLQSDSSGSSHSRTGNNSSGGTGRGRVNQLTLIRGAQGSERLPGTVLEARARLLERLHGISVSENRQNVIASSISRNELVVENDFLTVDPDDWEIEIPREWIEYDPQENFSKKRPGLSLEAICNLPLENFEDAQENDGVVKQQIECCICLERFAEGERLLRLPCYHRFHPSCLEPWLRNCGDCPYCRTSI